MKTFLQNALSLLKKYNFILFAFVALVLPDVMLKRLVHPGTFTENFVPITAGLFTLAWVCVILFLCVILLSKRWGRIVFAVISVLFTVYAFSESMYYKIFDQFFWLKSIALAGEGADYLSYVFKLMDANIIVCVVLALASIVLALVFWKDVKVGIKAKCIFMLVPVLVIVAVHVYLQPVFQQNAMNQWDTWRKPRAVYKNFTDANRSFEITGIYQFLYLNAYTTIFPNERYTEEDYKKAEAFFEAKGEMPVHEYTELFKGKNVIAVMMESMDGWAIDKKTTPTLHYMMSNGINFSNYNAPLFGSGFTLGSEFAFNTGYYTPLSAVSPAHFSGNSYPYALANLFRDAGYATNSFHFNEATFYNRGILHRAFGYEKYNAFEDFGLSGVEAELDSNILKNDDIYKKMTEKQPFFSFVITYSAHLPYTDDSPKLKLAKTYRPELIDETMHPEENSMQILAADTDAFFKQLLTRLEADGLLEDTVIVAFTDHFSYGISDEALLSECRGDELIYRVPAFIYAKGIKPVKISKPMMTADWAPTLVNLFGLDREGDYLGNDILDPENDGFVYFENWSWMDSERYYNLSEEKEEEETDYIREQNQRVKASMDANNIVILGDYYANFK
ncbi:MAG: hypothetical protein E7400_00585 [Ruminococcaceae bacterium]|nr:hypothetical protein [Oscillospiraceae bacterium]